jgi:protein gp37
MGDLFHAEVTDETIARIWAVMAATPHHTYQVLTKRPARMRALLSHPGFGAMVANTLVSHPALTDSPAARAAKPLEPGRSRPMQPLPNVWLGVSAEDQHWADIRIPPLLATPAAVRFVSCEPLLGPVDLTRIPYRGDRDYVLDALAGRYGEREPHTSFFFGMAALHPIDWVIAGGESGPGARPMHPAWARSLRDQCTNSHRKVPYFFKQWGQWAPSGRIAIGANRPDRVLADGPVDDLGHREELRRVGKGTAGRELDGRTWDQYPTARQPAQEHT